MIRVLTGEPCPVLALLKRRDFDVARAARSSREHESRFDARRPSQLRSERSVTVVFYDSAIFLLQDWATQRNTARIGLLRVQL